MGSSLNQVIAEGVLHARRIEQRTAAEKPHDVGDQRVMPIDREGQPGYFTLERQPCAVTELQVERVFRLIALDSNGHVARGRGTQIRPSGWTATGSTPARYLYYKNVNREIAL